MYKIKMLDYSILPNYESRFSRDEYINMMEDRINKHTTKGKIAQVNKYKKKLEDFLKPIECIAVSDKRKRDLENREKRKKENAKKQKILENKRKERIKEKEKIERERRRQEEEERERKKEYYNRQLNNKKDGDIFCKYNHEKKEELIAQVNKLKLSDEDKEMFKKFVNHNDKKCKDILLKKFHPDKNINNSQDHKELGNNICKLINLEANYNNGK
jgi:hypothetical protein